ncbi:MAG: glycosyltransferase [Pseudomonadota bacterium]
MIPKQIHYCWFGDQAMSVLNRRCIASWQQYCPDYELVFWNEANADIDNEYCRQAIKQKKWAFVADWVRFDVLRKHGGVYLDTDIELIRPLDGLLQDARLYTAWESGDVIGAGFIAAPPGHPAMDAACRVMLERLTALRRFATAPRILKHGLDAHQRHDCVILPPPSFYPFNPFDDANPRNAGQLMYGDIEAQTVGIHHYAMSWNFNKEGRLLQRVLNRLRPAPDWRLTVAF